MAGHKLPPKPVGLVIGQVRAQGSYGTVHSGELDGSPVVVKKLHHVLLQAPDNDKLMSDFYKECRILSTIRHANVVRFIGAYWDQEAKEPLLVMEAAKENLREFLERNKAHLGLEKQLAISSSMTEGLRFLHERAEPIIHRDLKPENVLVWEDGTVKIGDFGQSKLLGQPQSYMKTTQPGTVAYMPPEALRKKPSYTSKVDVFSLGVVMLEVCTQTPPSLSLVGIGTMPEVERHEDDLALLEDTHPLKPLIIWCLQDTHESRPDVKATHGQVKLLEGGVKETDYQQRIRQLEVALRESRESETGLQTRLQEAVSELKCTKAQVADLRIVVENEHQEVRKSKEREVDLKAVMEQGQQDLRKSEEREASLQRRLQEAVSELECTNAQVADLQIVVEKGHQEVRETKLQYEAELTNLRQTLDAWKATAERRDEECLSKVRELESLLSTRRHSATMQSAGELASSMLPSPLMTSTTVQTPPSPDAEDLPTPVKCVDCESQLSAEEIQHRREQGEALVCGACRSAHMSQLHAGSEGQGLLDQASEDTRRSPEVVPEGPMCKLPGCPKQAQGKGKYNAFCSKAHYQMYDLMTPSPVSLKPSTPQRSPTSPTGGAVSHATASSGWHSSWESHGSQPLHHRHLPWGGVGILGGMKACYSCGTVYSPVDLGACPKCCPRDTCKSKCGKPAFYSLELGLFSYCSSECRDRCELEGARREVASLVKEFEVNPVRDMSRAPAKESSVNHGATSQLPTRCSPWGDDTPTTAGVTPGPPSTQQPPPPQNQATMKYHNCKLTFDAVCAMSLYDSGRIQTVNSTKGMLVASVEVNKDTLACGVQPLDLITQLDGKRAESLGNTFGHCNLLVKMTKTVADAWIARASLIPSMSDLQQGFVESHQFSRKYRIVGFLVTQKDLMDPASFLGVYMDGQSNGRKVDRVEVLSEAGKAGLRKNDIIESVTLVTTDGEVHGPDVEWTFDSISRYAKSSPSVFALLMIVLNY